MSDEPIYCPNGEEVTVRAYHSPLSRTERIALEISELGLGVALANLTHDQARELIRRIEAALAEQRQTKETP